MKLGEALTAYETEVVYKLNEALHKHGEQRNITIDKQLNILTEEYLELVQAINDGEYNNAIDELAQCGAMQVKLMRLLMEVDDELISNDD